MQGADRGEDGGGVWMRRRRRGAVIGTLECGKLDVNGLGECGKAKKFGKKAGKRKFLITDACGQDASVPIKKAGQKIVSHSEIEPETYRPRSKCLSIKLCQEFKHKVV